MEAKKAEISPHGSKTWELMRYLANLLLTDAQRKKVKNTLIRIQQVPLKLMGIQALLDAQKAEIDRLKSRQTTLDGKFNIALYGLPKREDTFQAKTLSPNSLLFQASPSAAMMKVVSDQLTLHCPRGLIKALTQSDPVLSRFQPNSCLVMGLESPSLAVELKEGWPTLQKFHLNDVDSGLIQRWTSTLRQGGLAIEELLTDPMTALISLSSQKFDSIFCINRYQQLAPIEQIHFFELAINRLNPQGVLTLTLPKDFYWEDPRNLRPYSEKMVEAFLGHFPGEWKKVDKVENHVVYLFRKRGN